MCSSVVPSSDHSGGVEPSVPCRCAAPATTSLRREGGDPMTVPSVAPTVIAYRKACQPAGTGLSHYVLVTNTAPHLDASSETNLR